MDLYSCICTNVNFPDLLITCCNYAWFGAIGRRVQWISLEYFSNFLWIYISFKIYFLKPTSISSRQMRQMLWILWFWVPNTHYQWSPVHCAHISLLATPTAQKVPMKTCGPRPHMLPWGQAVPGLILALGWRWLLFALDSDLEGWRPGNHTRGLSMPLSLESVSRNGKPAPEKIVYFPHQSCLWVSWTVPFLSQPSHRDLSRQLFVTLSLDSSD